MPLAPAVLDAPQSLFSNTSPLERFFDVLQVQQDDPPGEYSPEGWGNVFARIRAAVPYLPAILAFGEWPEWTSGPTCAAIDAAARTLPREHDTELVPDDCSAETFDRMDAHYLVGLLVGVSLAQVLTSTKVR